MRLVVFSVSTSVRHYVGLAVTTCIYFLCFRALSRLAGTATWHLAHLLHSCRRHTNPRICDGCALQQQLVKLVRLRTVCSDNGPCYPCAAPTHGTGGELIHGGSDLAQPGFTGYYFDAIYICIAVQLATILSDWFWLLFLSVRRGTCAPYVHGLGCRFQSLVSPSRNAQAPAYGLYKLWRAVIQPWLAAPRVQQVRHVASNGLSKRHNTCMDGKFTETIPAAGPARNRWGPKETRKN